MNKFDELIKVADIHAARIKLAMEKIVHILPFEAQNIENMSEEDIAWVELLVSRFSKLQDFIGRKIIDAFLEAKKEMVDDLSMIDKLNKLERLDVIDDVSVWQDIRDARNHLTHEYPEHPELTAKHLNQMVALIPKLLSLFEALRK